jgi:predicted Zn-dependent peptidase
VLAEPYGEFGEWIQKMSFAEHPYKRPTIGNIAELDAAKLAEVRAFHDTYYRPDNAVLVVAGDFDPATLQGWVDKYFGPVARPETPIPRVTVHEPPRKAARTLRDSSPKIPLPALAMTYVGPAIGSDAAPALAVLEEALSGGESSRLYQSLIYAQELAQTAEFKADLRADMGLLTFQLVLASGVDVAKARSALLEEIKKVCEAPLRQNSPRQRARHAPCRTRDLRRQGCGSRKRRPYVRSGAREQRFCKVEAITAEEVQAAARRGSLTTTASVLDSCVRAESRRNEIARPLWNPVAAALSRVSAVEIEGLRRPRRTLNVQTPREDTRERTTNHRRGTSGASTSQRKVSDPQRKRNRSSETAGLM